MPTPLESLVATGTKLWCDSVDPDLVVENKKLGATGATSNPIIIADLINSGRFDNELTGLMNNDLSDEEVAWQMTDRLVRHSQEVFADVYEATAGDDGYVSFELDPLLEDADCALSVDERAQRYIELGKSWSSGHQNRMIKVPATPAGLAALENLAAAGITLNVTLIFSDRQYKAAREAIWRGAQRFGSLDQFKSVYSIFVSRIDVYTAKNASQLSEAAQGEVGLLNAKRIWQENQAFWSELNFPLKQEIIFASTGTKNPDDPIDKYIGQLTGSDIQTNPPGTNVAIQELEGREYQSTLGDLPSQEVIEEIDSQIDFETMEQDLMAEGLKKFADPQKALIALIGEKRAALVSS
ncbi:MAG: transaldolase [Planctomycetaceae bacterium]|nr:transaldolase [Planctomycetaceae bacterium]